MGSRNNRRSNWRVSRGLWDLENAGIPWYEDAGDFLPALRLFINSFGFNGNDLELDVYVGDRDNPRRRIPERVYEAIESDNAVRVFSCKNPRTGRVPPQAADRAIDKELKKMHYGGFEGLLVIIAGDAGYKNWIDTIARQGRLKVLWIYPYPPRTGPEMRNLLWPMGMISVEDMMHNYHSQAAHA